MNSRINVQEVRLIASNGDQVGVVDTSKALELAKEEDLDLVEIVFCVCGKHLFFKHLDFRNTR